MRNAACHYPLHCVLDADPDKDVCFGMDVPCDPWTAEDIAFWSGTKHYQPWKDVAAFFKTHNNDEEPPCPI